MPKILYVVLDGVGDTSVQQYAGGTPLERASTPNLDRLAAKGRMGMLYTVKKGIAPESDAGVFSLLSYDPSKLDLSRGVVEALGSEVAFANGDLALRCNFATVKDDQLVDRRVGRNLSNEEARELAGAVNDDSTLRAMCEFELKATIGHRCSLVLHRGKMRLSSAISNLDPAYVREGKMTIARSVKLPLPIPKCRALARTQSAIQTARLLNRFAARVHEVLRNHSANLKRMQRGDLAGNFLLMRDVGIRIPNVRKLYDKYSLRAAAIADMPVELGIAKIVGMDTSIFPPDRTPEGYALRSRKAMQLAAKYDLVYVHLKGPDEPGHDGDCDGKRKSIEDIDAGFFGELGDLSSSIVCITADHATPCSEKGHTDDPVPLLVLGPGIDPDGSTRFTEYCGEKGALGIVKHGHEVLGLLERFKLS